MPFVRKITPCIDFLKKKKKNIKEMLSSMLLIA
jgi:hypothetical protein